MGPLESRVCRQQEWAEALRILYAHLPESEQEEHIYQLVTSAAQGDIRLEGLIGCWDQDRMVGAILCIPSPGRSVVAWPPRFLRAATHAEISTIRHSLFQGMRQYASTEKARLAQVLLATHEQENVNALEAEGFFHLAHLIYLRRPSNLRPIPAPPAEIEYVSYQPDRRVDFMQVLERSYEASHDCPQLTGARSMEDILESHRAQGVFDPNHWFLARRDGHWVGCLLLAGLPEYNALEVAYVAVLPEARGEGMGRELIHQAIRVCQLVGVDIVTLAVDSRNVPARKLYEDEGFTEWDRRDAYLLLLDPADGIFDRRCLLK